MRIRKKDTLALLILILVNTKTVISQALPDSLTKRIDNLFSEWNTPNSPGCAIGIIRNDSLVYAKGYGMADIEHAIPITPATIFYMCSVSKQFTGYSIVLLARQGKIKLDEDIHTYISWAPDFGEKITVRNLLNHTSGIRDDISLAAISGLGYDGMLTQDLALNILKRQRSLNFPPGQKYSYSNSNYVLLSEIVKTVSGKSFRTFSDSAIFKPLGMEHSRFQDNYTELIQNRAFSYEPLDSNHFSNDFQNVYTLGDGGLFTNINDMSKWVANFYNPIAGDLKDINQLTENGKLDNGKKIDYALGINVDKYRGWQQFQHGGGLAGYRTFISVFPDLKIGFLVFSNVGNFDPYAKTHDLANLFISDTTKPGIKNKPENKDSSLAILKNPQHFNIYVGDYISEDGVQFNFSITNQKMYWNCYGQSSLLRKEAKDTFSVFTNPDIKFVFEQSPKKSSIVNQYWPYNNRVLKKYVSGSLLTDKELRLYTGIYYSPELECQFGISLKDHHLFLTSNKYENRQLTMVGNDNIIDKNGGLGHITILRDIDKKIIGFEVNSGAIMHLKFNKVE